MAIVSGATLTGAPRHSLYPGYPTPYLVRPLGEGLELLKLSFYFAIFVARTNLTRGSHHLLLGPQSARATKFCLSWMPRGGLNKGYNRGLPRKNALKLSHLLRKNPLDSFLEAVGCARGGPTPSVSPADEEKC